MAFCEKDEPPASLCSQPLSGVSSPRSSGTRPASHAIRGHSEQGGEHHSLGAAEPLAHCHLLLVAWQQHGGNSSEHMALDWTRALHTAILGHTDVKKQSRCSQGKKKEEEKKETLSYQ